MSTSVRIKVCGLSRKEDVLLAEELGAWALGFIFYKKSPRSISPDLAAMLGKQVKNPKVLRIGVFVDSSLDEILNTVAIAGLTGIQLHGEETPELCSSLKSHLPTHQLIKAFRPHTADDLSCLPNYSMCDAILIDAFVPGQPGGTGRIARWDLAGLAKASGNLILSGGLNAENILLALKDVQPYAIDVSSGLEDLPAIKSHLKMRVFFKTVGNYENQS